MAGIIETENRMGLPRAGEWGSGVMQDKGYTFSVIKRVSSEDLMYSRMTMANYMVPYT